MSPLNPLNPLTGDVPVPEDQREIDAALRAGCITHRIFPYFDWRYGERGRKFTQSDSAWLAWLTRYDQDKVLQQILWLGSVLSNRGMPRWLLETHLFVMRRTLTRWIPDKSAQYEKLLRAAEQLRRARQAIIAEPSTGEIADRFAQRCGGEPQVLLRGTARLIVSAVADHRANIKNAIVSLRDWLLNVEQLRKLAEMQAALTERQRRQFDSAKFAHRWAAAVESAIGEAQRAASDG